MIAVAVFFAFLIGSIPVAAGVGRLRGIDLTTVGTGNVGAGNAARTVGLRAGTLVAVLDGLKGMVPVLVARQAGFSNAALAAVGLASVAGNNWPVWRHARGGRGLAASAGVVLGYLPALIIWPGVWAAVGWAIGGGLAGFYGWGLLGAFALWVQPTLPTVTLGLGLGAMMILRRAQGNAGLRGPGMWKRIIHDDDARSVVHPSRPLAVEGGRMLWIPALLIVGFPAYLWLAGSRATDVRLAAGTVTLLLAATTTELGAKFAFGALFRQGVSAVGMSLSMGAAFRAALVGTGVARLIPAGGVVTPLAMAWAVEGENKRVAGAAVRATVLSYGGLAGATGVGLLWASVVHPPGHAARTTGFVGAVLLALSLGIIAFAGHLRRLTDILPIRYRERVRGALVEYDMDRKAWGLLTARTLLEAATLGLTLAAFDISMAPSQVVAAFGVSQIVGGLPGSPGGLGVTEAGLLGALTLFGIPATAAAAPVLTFRMISFWLPAIGGFAAGGHAYLRSRSDQASRFRRG